MQEIYNKLIKKINKSNVFLNEPMSKHTSFKIGGPADIFIKIKKLNELKYILKLAKRYSIKIYIIGNGTNVLVKDKGIRGIVLKLEMNEYKLKKDIIKVESRSIFN